MTPAYAPSCPCDEQRALARLHGWSHATDWRTCRHACAYPPLRECADAPAMPRGARKRWRRAALARIEIVCMGSPRHWRASDILADLFADDAEG